MLNMPLALWRSALEAPEIRARCRRSHGLPRCARNDRGIHSKRWTLPDSLSAWSCIGAHDFDVAALGIFQNLVGLVVGGILLVLGGHAHLVGGTQAVGLGSDLIWWRGGRGLLGFVRCRLDFLWLSPCWLWRWQVIKSIPGIMGMKLLDGDW